MGLTFHRPSCKCPLKTSTYFFLFCKSWKTENWIQYLPGNEANSNSMSYSSSTGVYGHTYLPHCDLECWYQLLVQQGHSIFWYGQFQLPSAKESSDGAKQNNKPSVLCISCINFPVTIHYISYFLVTVIHYYDIETDLEVRYTGYIRLAG